MRKRKKLIVDRAFQLKTAFSIIGIVFMMISIIIAFIGINVAVNNQQLNRIAINEESTISTQINIFKSLIIFQKNRTWDNLKIATDRVSKDLNENTSLMNKNIGNIRDLIFINNVQIFVIIIFVLLQGLVLYFVLIKKTHKISGPMYIMSRYMNDVIKGKYPALRPLRKNDELKEFYSLFSKMMDSLKERKAIK